MIKIIFHKLLLPYTNDIKECDIEIVDYESLFLFIENMFPNLHNYITTNNDILTLVSGDKKIINEVDILRNEIKVSSLYVLPSIFGSGKGGFGKIALGIAMVALSFAVPGAGAGPGALSQFGTGGFGAITSAGIANSIASTLLSTGLNMILGGILSSFTPKTKIEEPTLDSKESRRNNDPFEGLQNTVDSSQPIPLQYGYTRVAGHLASGYIKSIVHQKNDTIRVSNYV